MSPRSVICGLALSASFATGCGTMANFDVEGRRKAGVPQPPTAFGGVHRDFKWAAETMTVNCPLPNKMLIGLPRATIYMIDVPFSAVGDLVTLPMVVLAGEEESAPPRAGLKSEFVKEPLPEDAPSSGDK